MRGLALLAAVLCPALATAGAADTTPEGLKTSDWSGIRAAYEVNRHSAYAVSDGWQARNPGQAWRTRFDGRGFLITPDGGGWSWGLELVCYGRAGAERPVETPACVAADGGRVHYQWDDTLTEWYVNDPRGLEHGYTLLQRPACHCCGSMAAPGSECSTDRFAQPGDAGGTHLPVQFTLALRGNLQPRVSGDGRDVMFVNEAGSAVVNYAGLRVFDADGMILSARIAAIEDGLILSVDDIGANYPLTIDPIAQQAYIKASNTEAGDQFGYSVCISGDTMIVGAYGEDSSATGVNGNQADNNASDSGAAYVFVRDAAGNWNQQAYLKASNAAAADRFGWSVSVSGDTAVVGAIWEDSSTTGSNGNEADNQAPQSGAAYVFDRDLNGNWSQQAYLKASNPGLGDWYGYSVTVSGETVVVGAPHERSNATGVNGDQTDNSALGSGAAYIFTRDVGGNWSQQAYLKASNTNADDRFGWTLSVSGDTLAVGAHRESSSATGVNGNQADNSALYSGATYLFVRDAGGVWSQQAYLKASNTAAGDAFGWSVCLSHDTLVIGAPGEASSATGVDGNQADNSALASGAAYVFVRDVGGVWSQQAYLKASNAGAEDLFGHTVSVAGDIVVVGGRWEDSIATGVDGNGIDNSAPNSGAAYNFARDAGGVWSQRAYLKASNTGTDDWFGASVSVSGVTVVVGAWQEDSSATGVNGDEADNSAIDAGAVYVFNVGPAFAGDANCDGTLDLADVSPLVQALVDPAGYAAAFPDCDPADWEPDGNGEVNGDDITMFVDLLLGP